MLRPNIGFDARCGTGFGPGSMTATFMQQQRKWLKEGLALDLCLIEFIKGTLRSLIYFHSLTQMK